jgi:transcriptional regulator with XRE-family HTH domain
MSVRCLYIIIMPKRKRRPKHSDLGFQVARRLEELREERGMNYSQFARVAGVPRPQHNSWRNDGRVPGGFHLCQIAERLGVTTDWLLGIKDAPKYPTQQRPDNKLVRDLAIYLQREISLRVAVGNPEMSVQIRPDDVQQFLRDTVQQESDRVLQWHPYSVKKQNARSALNELIRGFGANQDKLDQLFEACGWKREQIVRALTYITYGLEDMPSVPQPALAGITMPIVVY